VQAEAVLAYARRVLAAHEWRTVARVVAVDAQLVLASGERAAV